MSVLTPVTAAVLAGGRSRRFGGDKLAALLDGRSLLDHAVAAVAPLAAEVLIVVGDDHPSAAVDQLPASPGPPVRVVVDRIPDAGPAAGLRTALEHAREPALLIVAGDMPRLSRSVLELLVRTLEAADPDTVDAVTLVHRGRVQPLPLVLRVGAGTAAAQAAASSGDRSLLGAIGRLRLRRLDEDAWRPLDPEALTLVDVDRPDDLARLARGR